MTLYFKGHPEVFAMARWDAPEPVRRPHYRLTLDTPEDLELLRRVYGALYRAEEGNLKRRTDYLLGPVEDLVSQIKEPAIFLGDGCALYRDRIVERMGSEATFAAQELWLPRAETLARLGSERLRQGQRDDPAALVPMYLYPQDASIDPRIRQAVATGKPVLTP